MTKIKEVIIISTQVENYSVSTNRYGIVVPSKDSRSKANQQSYFDELIRQNWSTYKKDENGDVIRIKIPDYTPSEWTLANPFASSFDKERGTYGYANEENSTKARNFGFTNTYYDPNGNYGTTLKVTAAVPLPGSSFVAGDSTFNDKDKVVNAFSLQDQLSRVMGASTFAQNFQTINVAQALIPEIDLLSDDDDKEKNAISAQALRMARTSYMNSLYSSAIA